MAERRSTVHQQGEGWNTIGFFKLTEFIDAIKITWIRTGTSDHWCDIIDNKLGLNEWNRKKVWKMGDQSFDNLINSRLHGLSSITKAYSRFVMKFPQPVVARDYSWFCQPIFKNSNIKTKNCNLAK
jgi:hypothetical protein